MLYRALATTLLAFCLLLGTLTAEAFAARWTRQVSGTSQHLADITFATAHTGWTCGSWGTIMRTETDGSSWMRQTSGTTKSLTSLSFVDARLGWTAGYGGTIRRTVDSGTTWTGQPSGTTADLRSIKFYDARLGAAGGKDGTSGIVLVTTDGGSLWRRPTLPPTGAINAVSFSASSTAWAVGESSVVYRSTDGGSTWHALFTAAQPLTAVTFIDPRRGWIGGANGLLLATDDFGETWKPQTSTSSGTICRIRFIDPNNGWASTSGPGLYTGSVLRTGNGGNTWVKDYDTHMPMPGLAAYAYDMAWIAGWNGTIVRRTDYEFDLSTKWIPRRAGTAPVTAVDFPDAARGWAVTHVGAIYRSTNGGVTWAPQVPMSAAALRDVRFRTSRHGWAVGDSGLVMHTDDGASWRAQREAGHGSTKYSLAVTGSSSAWAVGNHMAETPPAGNVVRTIDGGATWPSLDAPFTNSLRGTTFSSASEGWMVGLGGMIAHTSNGTAADPSWDTTRPIGRWQTLSSVTFPNSSTGIVVGQDGIILRTTNSGGSWHRPAVPSGLSLSSVASTGTDAWAVGSKGVILHSSDRGATWYRQVSGTTQSLTSVRALSKDLVWASGNAGVILTGGLPLSLSRPTLSTSSVRRGITFVIRSYLAPQHTAGRSSVQFQLFRVEGRRLVLRKTVSATNTNSGTRTLCSVRTSVSMTGYWKVRARHLADRHPEMYTAMTALSVPH